MKCSEYELIISLSLSGELPKEDELSLEAHLKECESCRQFLLEEKKILKEIKNLEFRPDSKLDRQILAQIEQENRAKDRVQSFNFKTFKKHKLSFYLSIAAVFILLIINSLNTFETENLSKKEFNNLVTESQNVIYTDFSDIDYSLNILDNNMDLLVVSDFLLEENSIDSVLMSGSTVLTDNSNPLSTYMSGDLETTDLLDMLE